MLPLLAAPWALAALASIPALAALYWLRNTWREVPVSSLMFWMHQSESQASGLKMRQLQTPLLFFLEIAALLLLAFAATGPRVDTGQGRWPLVVVLDDSFSMQAGGDDSARRLAEKALQSELRWGEDHPVRFILAGEYPQALGDTAWSWTEAKQALSGWQCRSGVARLPQAVALAGELSGDKARILVVSDHGPEHDPGEGRVQWWSFGKPRANFAFVNAARSVREGQDRCLLEIANFNSAARSTILILETSAGQEIHRETLALAADEIRRLAVRLPSELPIVRAKLSDDALNVDNVVALVREETPTVRVDLKLTNEPLRVPLAKALAATGKTSPPGERPDLLITDEPDVQPAAADTWLVQIMAEKDADSYVGPFVLDRAHPLTEGLHLAGVVWGAGTAREIVGAPVIMAGSVPLVTDAEGFAGRHQVRLRLRPDLSTLLEAPAFPILIWNLINWRAAELPGLRRVNVRLGESVPVAVPLGVESVIHLPPHGSARTLAVTSQRVTLRPDEAGLHEVHIGPEKHTFAVNALQREESDLTGCVTGRWGEWTEDLATAPALYHLAWMPLLLVLGVLTLHMALAFRAGK